MPLRDTIFPFISSRTLANVAFMAIAIGAYSLLAVLKENSSFQGFGDVPSNMHASLSMILGCLLVFRINTAYSRWWEARTLWGTLVNTSRNVAVKWSTLVKLTDKESHFLRTSLSDFPKQLAAHLRTASPTQVESNRLASHLPMQNVLCLYDCLDKQKKSGQADSVCVRVLDMELTKLLEVCGACERIARTPFIRSYRIFVRQCIALFLFSFPWGVAQDYQWWTIPLTITVAYFMLGMEIVSEHIEEPFGFDEDDLDLDGMCQTIERSMSEVFAVQTTTTDPRTDD